MKNEITINYKIDKDSKIIFIFGEKFVKNNKNICKYIYENKKYELINIIDLTNIEKSKYILKIKLIGIKNVTNISFLFEGCKSLISVPDISDWDTSNITDMSYIFSNCVSLISLPDISKWNTSNVHKMD